MILVDWCITNSWLIDANGANPVVVTGSMNWSANGDESNDENTLIFSDATTAQAYLAEVTTLYNDVSNDRLCPSTDYFIYLPIVVEASG